VPDPRGEAELFDAASALVGGYRPVAGAYDEMIGADGALRAHWRGYIDGLATLGRDELARRADAVARRVREAGVFHRVYGAERDLERPWPLSFAPVVIEAQEWRAIEAGVIQRARLIEATLADAYGPQRMIGEGVLPPAAVAGSPDFLRPMVGAKPKGGRFLHFYAADLGRGPDGRWWVLQDRTQAPSGAGFALGNRVALSRVLPETMRDLDVQRVAGFFQALRQSLAALSRRDMGRVCLMTPGPFNDTYFEHAYLARYLGFLLVEGDDLAIRNDNVFVRTVAGLRQIDVLIRRVDADFVDPLELNPASRLGAAGLARAARAGAVAFANALGSGIAESRAMMSFWPRLAERLLSEPLLMPNIATWWCGQEDARRHVEARVGDLTIAPAFAGDGDEALRDGPVNGAELSASARAGLFARMARRGGDYVGQEMVRLSTTPVWRDGRFAPRPFQLRVFAAATEDGGWVVMPGAFCRVAHDLDPRAISLQRGGVSADAWVLADGPAAATTLLPNAGAIEITRPRGALTSRTADNLFWLGRYLERTEATLRIVRALIGRAAERDPAVRAVCEQLTALLAAWGAVAKWEEGAAPLPHLAAGSALVGAEGTGAALSLAYTALRAASSIRDRLSPDAWRTIQELPGIIAADGDLTERTDRALGACASFSGFAQENMVRGAGWAFLEVGRRIERGLAMTRFVSALGLAPASSAALDALLELGDSQITYAQRYFVTPSPAAAADLLLFEESNPRACAFQAVRLHELADQLPEGASGDAPAAFRKTVVLIEAALATGEPADVDAEFVARLDAALLQAGAAFADLYLANRDRIAHAGPADGRIDG